MNPKTFTREEANKMLPLLRSILRDVTSKSRQIQGLRRSLARESGKHSRLDPDLVSQGPTPAAQKTSREIQELQAEIDAHQREVEELGCLLKDADLGIVDFPAFIGEELVYLCWRFEEDRVEHYHGVREGFAGRRPLPEPDLTKRAGS